MIVDIYMATWVIEGSSWCISMLRPFGYKNDNRNGSVMLSRRWHWQEEWWDVVVMCCHVSNMWGSVVYVVFWSFLPCWRESHILEHQIASKLDYSNIYNVYPSTWSWNAPAATCAPVVRCARRNNLRILVVVTSGWLFVLWFFHWSYEASCGWSVRIDWGLCSSYGMDAISPFHVGTFCRIKFRFLLSSAIRILCKDAAHGESCANPLARHGCDPKFATQNLQLVPLAFCT